MARQMTLLESMRDDSKRLRDMLSDGFNRLFADAKLITPPLASSAIPKEPGAVFDAWCSVSGLARQDEADWDDDLRQQAAMYRQQTPNYSLPIVWLVSVCPIWLPLSGIMRGAAARGLVSVSLPKSLVSEVGPAFAVAARPKMFVVGIAFREVEVPARALLHHLARLRDTVTLHQPAKCVVEQSDDHLVRCDAFLEAAHAQRVHLFKKASFR
jgi:hypothetical protein